MGKSALYPEALIHGASRIGKTRAIEYVRLLPAVKLSLRSGHTPRVR